MNKKDMSLEFVHGDFYGVAMEVVKKWVSKYEARPILNYARHTDGGSIIATDSHRMITIKNIHGFKEEYLVNPKNFTFAKGVYPNVEGLNARENHTESIVLSKEHIKLWLQIFKSMNQTLKVMKDHFKNVKLKFQDNHIEMELIGHDIVIQLPHEVYQKPKMEVISFNVEYMRDALEAHFKLNSEQITMYFNGPLKPFILDDENTVQTLILPVRTS